MKSVLSTRQSEYNHDFMPPRLTRLHTPPLSTLYSEVFSERNHLRAIPLTLYSASLPIHLSVMQKTVIFSVFIIIFHKFAAITCISARYAIKTRKNEIDKHQ